MMEQSAVRLEALRRARARIARLYQHNQDKTTGTVEYRRQAKERITFELSALDWAICLAQQKLTTDVN